MRKLLVALGALALALGVAGPVAAHPVVSFGVGFGFRRPWAPPIYCPPYPFYAYPYASPPPAYYYPPPYYPYPLTVGGYDPTLPYFVPRDEGIRSYTFPGYRDWPAGR